MPKRHYILEAVNFFSFCPFISACLFRPVTPNFVKRHYNFEVLVLRNYPLPYYNNGADSEVEEQPNQSKPDRMNNLVGTRNASPQTPSQSRSEMLRPRPS